MRNFEPIWGIKRDYTLQRNGDAVDKQLEVKAEKFRRERGLISTIKQQQQEEVQSAAAPAPLASVAGPPEKKIKICDNKTTSETPPPPLTVVSSAASPSPLPEIAKPTLTPPPPPPPPEGRKVKHRCLVSYPADEILPEHDLNQSSSFVFVLPLSLAIRT